MEGIICIVGIWLRGTGPTSGPGPHAATSALIGRRATTMGGTVVAGMLTVPVCLGVSVGLTSRTSSPTAGDTRVARPAGIPLRGDRYSLYYTDYTWACLVEESNTTWDSSAQKVLSGGA